MTSTWIPVSQRVEVMNQPKGFGLKEKVCLFWILGQNGATQSAACGKDAGDSCPFGFAGFDQVLEDAVHRVFVKNTNVAVGVNVAF